MRIKRNKYGAKKCSIDGIKFDSKKEARRYLELKLMQRAGVISELKQQVPFKFECNGIKICTYKADFVYFEKGVQVVEDCKGFLTPIYKLKKKLMKAFYKIEIKET